MDAQNGPERQTLTVEEAAAVLGIGRNNAYQAITSGELPVLRIGRRLLVPRAALATRALCTHRYFAASANVIRWQLPS
jgi:excisionase family DNA binding protein